MPLRLATFNVKDFFLPRQPDEVAVVEAKIANVAEQLRKARADVVALQEVGAPELLDRLVTKELADLGYGAPVVAPPDRRGIRNAIVSRMPILWSQVHTAHALSFPKLVASDPDPFAGKIPLRRGVVHVRLDAGPLGEVDVLTAHFKSGRAVPLKDDDGREVEIDSPRAHGEAVVRSLVLRMAEALHVRKLIDDLFEALPDHAVCVMGDLNDLVDSVPVRILRGYREDDRRILRSCSDLVAEERRYSCHHGTRRTLIDHILLSEKLFRAVRTVDIFNETLRSHGPFDENAPLCADSDHALCVVEVDG
jgi:endonuclease/exonuclease/phosphatase family metal-dependent hydrolase